MRFLKTLSILGLVISAAAMPLLAHAQTQAEEAAAAPITSPVIQPTSFPLPAASSPMGIEMVVIQAGQGQLGSPQNELKRARFENPLQTTFIDYAFEVGKYEITFNDWDKCVAGGGCNGYRPKDGGWGKGNRPVINISFEDAQSYIKWLNQKTGKTYRLLSEAEWEYVARAGQTSAFGHDGQGISARIANFDGKAPYISGETGPYLRKTQPVGQYAANGFGIHDIYGNVYEWVEDCWNADHQGAPGTGAARKDGDLSLIHI